MAEVISIKVETVGVPKVNEQLKAIKEYVDYLNTHKITINAETTGSIDKFTKQVTAYNNSLARRVKAETQLATAIENRKAAESRAQAAHERTLQAQQRTIQVQERTKQATERVTQAQAKLAIEQQRTQQVTQKTIQSENKLAAEREKTAQTTQRTIQSENRLAVEQERTAQAQERTAQSANKLASQQERTAQAALKDSAAQRKANTEHERGAKTASSLTASLSSVMARYLSLSVIVYKVTSAFRDALKTMKEVDSALVTIQKTTGYTGERLEQLTKNAYELATAYGRTATEILNAASVYARAGFKDNLEQMTELSALLQNVGDLEGETAAKFLVAANAAWQLNGSYESLLAIIDGLNEQTNQAAVDMAGLTSGITVAGSVFAAAGESVQTFAGLLGTAIAVTQRSGSEVGRGLRTIAMNIRQIKGELDDGEIIDEASISDAAKALHSIGISVADRNGELRMTSAVLNELAGKWDKLTTAEQSYIAQSLAGKRQANILVSLMRNWDEAQRQMGLYANGAGSAMKENEIYLNSWEAKTKQLSASWTKFVSGLVDTQMIKDALDGVIKLVNLLDTQMGRTVVTAGALTLAITGIASALAKVATLLAANPTLLGLLGGAAAATVAFTAIANAVDSVVHATENWTKAAQTAWDKFSEINSEIDSLKSKTDGLTEVEQRRLEILQAEADAAQAEAEAKALSAYYSEYMSGTTNVPDVTGKGIQIQAKSPGATESGKVYGGVGTSVVDANGNSIFRNPFGFSIVGTGENRGGEDTSLKTARELVTTWHKLNSEMKTAGEDTFRELEQKSNDTVVAITNMANQLNDLSEILGDKMPQAGKDALEILVTFLGGLNRAKGGVNSLGDGLDDVAPKVDKLHSKLQSFSDNATTLDTVIGAVTDALKKYGEGSVEVYDAMRNLESTIPGSTDKLYDFETATLLSGDALDGTKSSLLDLIDAQKQVNFQHAIDEFARASAAALELAGSIALAMPEGAVNSQFLEAYTVNSNNPSLQKLKQQKEDWDSWVSTLRGRSDYKGGGGGGSTSTSDPELARLQNIVKLRKQEVEFLKASGKSQDEINAKQKEVQAALHDLAEYMRKIEADEADILSLSTEWWTIQNSMAEVEEDQLKVYQDRVSLLKSQLSLLEAQGADTDTIEAKQREIQDALKAQMDYMESIGASQAEINALATEWWNIENNILDTHKKLFDELKKTIDEYYDAAVTDKEKELQLEEKILEVQKAQVALANAQKERTVRYFNAASGQWEWGANQKNVQAAKDALQKAQESLNDYQKEQAWKEFKDAWEYVAEQIKAGAITFNQAYEYMERKMKELQNKYNVDMSGVLKDSVGQFKGVNKTIKEFNGQTATELGNAVGELKKQNEQLKAQTGVLNTSTENAKSAVEAFKQAFDNVAEAVKNGDMTFDEAYQTLKDAAVEISDKYGVDMTDALDLAVQQMSKIYSGLDGIAEAVAEGALTPAQAFDIISDALNAVSEKYGKNITDEVNAILEKKGGFKDGLAGLAKAVENGEISIEDAFGYIQDATQEVSEKYGIDMKSELDTAIQAMGKSSDALDDLWKAIVLNKMRMNSVSWLELDEEKKKAQEKGDTATVKRITEEQNALHAENEALGETIGATYDKSGYWSLNGQRLYDPVADQASGEFSGGGGAAGSRATNKNQDTIDAFGKHANSGQEQYFIPGMGVMNIGSAAADLFKMEAGMKGNDVTRYNVLYSGLFTPEEQAQYLSSGGIVTADMAAKWNSQPNTYLYDYPLAMQDSSVQQMLANSGFNANGEYEGYAKVYGGGAGNTMVKINNGQISVSGLEEMGSNMLVTADGSILRVDRNGHVYATGEKWESSRGSYDSTQKQVVGQLVFNEQNKMLESGDYSYRDIYGRDGIYDEGGVLHGVGGIKATARDEMVLPPDITERILRPTSNAFVDGRMDGLRAMLGMRTEFGSAGSTKIGTQNNGDNYIMNGVSISEGKARSTTVYELAQMARSLGSYQRS